MKRWGTMYRAVRPNVGRIGLLISRWRRGKIWNSTIVAEPEGTLVNQGVVESWGYTDTMYVVPYIAFFTEDSLVSVSDRLMTTFTRINWAPIWARVSVDVA